MKEPLKFSWQPELKQPSLVVGWNMDASLLGAKVTDYLNQKLCGQSFCEIEPVDFFPFGGVAIEDDLAQFPESRFYACPEHDLLIFKSDPPSNEYLKFLNLILDVAEHYCHIKEIYSIGGMVSSGAHTAPRQLVATFNLMEYKETFSQYDIAAGIDYETPPGHRPTLNSFLLWAAKKRNIRGVNLWVPIPFYLVSVDDAKARKRLIDFFNQRLNLGIDISDVNQDIKNQNEKLAQMRYTFPDIDASFRKLESNLRLSTEENQRLVKEIENLLSEND